MLFNSGFFLFGFLPIFFAFYFLANAQVRNWVLVGVSLFFYAWAEPVFVFWAFGSALLDYGLGFGIARLQTALLRKACVAVGVSANLSLLSWFKYANFAVRSYSSIASTLGAGTLTLAHIALPIAISFIVFEKITYLVDIYRGNGRPAPNLVLYLLYVFYFPKLLAGPIIRYCDIERQLTDRSISFDNVRIGTVRFIYGLGKKVLLADQVGHFSNQVFSLAPEQIDFGTAWLGVLCFTVQIYFDFSGYSDMALGLSRTMGFCLKENFRMPYLACSFTEFWRRWHISLSTWIREYLYIPLGGNRCSAGRIYFNLCLCFFLSGLWHGAAWPFVIWGVFHGVMLICDRLFWAKMQKRLPQFLNLSITFFLVMISWVIFRAGTYERMELMLRAMAKPWAPSRPNTLWFSGDIAFCMAVGYTLIFVPVVPQWQKFVEAYGRLSWRPVLELSGSVALLLIVLTKVSMESFNAFLYFRF